MRPGYLKGARWRDRPSVLTGKDLVSDQHPDSAGPALLAAGEIRRLLVENFAGSSVANLNPHVVIRLGRSFHHPNKGLFGPELQCDAGLATLAVSKRLIRYGAHISLACVDHAVSPRSRQFQARLAADFVQCGRTDGGFIHKRGCRTLIVKLEIEYG